jgi:hypothetical protein
VSNTYKNSATNWELSIQHRSLWGTLHIQTITEDKQMASKHMKRYSTSYVIRELQIKTMTYHIIPIRMAKIKNTDNRKFWWEYGATGTLTFCRWERKIVQPLSLTVSCNTKHIIHTTQSTNCTPWHLLKWVENLCHTRSCTWVSFSRQVYKWTVLHPRIFQC